MFLDYLKGGKNMKAFFNFTFFISIVTIACILHSGKWFADFCGPQTDLLIAFIGVIVGLILALITSKISLKKELYSFLGYHVWYCKSKLTYHKCVLLEVYWDSYHERKREWDHIDLLNCYNFYCISWACVNYKKCCYHKKLVEF